MSNSWMMPRVLPRDRWVHVYQGTGSLTQRYMRMGLRLCLEVSQVKRKACVGTSRGRQGGKARTALIIRTKPDFPAVPLRGASRSMLLGGK